MHDSFLRIIKKIVKNPNVDTSFLPDKERDEAIHREKLLQKQLWLDRQEKIKGSRSCFNYVVSSLCDCWYISGEYQNRFQLL